MSKGSLRGKRVRKKRIRTKELPLGGFEEAIFTLAPFCAGRCFQKRPGNLSPCSSLHLWWREWEKTKRLKTKEKADRLAAVSACVCLQQILISQFLLPYMEQMRPSDGHRMSLLPLPVRAASDTDRSNTPLGRSHPPSDDNGSTERYRSIHRKS